MQRSTFFDHVFKPTFEKRKKESNRWDLQILIEVICFFVNFFVICKISLTKIFVNFFGGEIATRRCVFFFDFGIFLL